MASGPVCCMVWEGLDAVKTGRVMLADANKYIPGTNPSDEPISELQAPGFVSDTLTSTRHFTLGNLYSDTGISLTL